MSQEQALVTRSCVWLRGFHDSIYTICYSCRSVLDARAGDFRVVPRGILPVGVISVRSLKSKPPPGPVVGCMIAISCFEYHMT